MGEKHIIAKYASNLQGWTAETKAQAADLAPELSFFRTLGAMPHGEGLLREFAASVGIKPFTLHEGWCDAPFSQDNGYIGPVVILRAPSDRHYVLTKEETSGELCLQIGNKEDFKRMVPNYDQISFGYMPHAISGPAVDVMRHLQRDVLDNTGFKLPERGLVRDLWINAVAKYLTDKSNLACKPQQRTGSLDLRELAVAG